MKYGDERVPLLTFPRVMLEHPQTLVDLGCGPGNSTQLLRIRWPNANIIGIDNSFEMIDAAKRTFPEQSGYWPMSRIGDLTTRSTLSFPTQLSNGYRTTRR